VDIDLDGARVALGDVEHLCLEIFDFIIQADAIGLSVIGDRVGAGYV
jgi:hypothetical protein